MKNLKMLYIALVALVASTLGACTTDFEAGPQASGHEHNDNFHERLHQ